MHHDRSSDCSVVVVEGWDGCSHWFRCSRGKVTAVPAAALGDSRVVAGTEDVEIEVVVGCS